jgi:hypothetical protein
MEWAIACVHMLDPEEFYCEKEPKEGDTALIYSARNQFCESPFMPKIFRTDFFPPILNKFLAKIVCLTGK